jgi:hypothetical protein
MSADGSTSGRLPDGLPPPEPPSFFLGFAVTFAACFAAWLLSLLLANGNMSSRVYFQVTSGCYILICALIVGRALRRKNRSFAMGGVLALALSLLLGSASSRF